MSNNNITPGSYFPNIDIKWEVTHSNNIERTISLSALVVSSQSCILEKSVKDIVVKDKVLVYSIVHHQSRE